MAKPLSKRKIPPLACEIHGDPRYLSLYEADLLKLYRQLEPYNIPVSQAVEGGTLTYYQINLPVLIALCHEFEIEFDRVHEELLGIHGVLHGHIGGSSTGVSKRSGN